MIEGHCLANLGRLAPRDREVIFWIAVIARSNLSAVARRATASAEARRAEGGRRKATKQFILSLRGENGLLRLGSAMTADEGPGSGQIRSSVLTIFWHCGFRHFSSRTALERGLGKQTVKGFGRRSGSKGSGNADRRLFIRSSGGAANAVCAQGDPAAFPATAYRRAASFILPLRAAGRFAPGHSGLRLDHQAFRAQTAARPLTRNFSK